MRKLFVWALLAVATLATAQERQFVIRGEMSSSAFCYSPGMVSEVRLEKNVDGLPVVEHPDDYLPDIDAGRVREHRIVHDGREVRHGLRVADAIGEELPLDRACIREGYLGE